MRTRIATVSDENRVSELLLASYTELMARDYEPGVLAASLPKMVRANTSLLGSGTFYIVDGPNSTAIGCGGWTLAAPGSGMETAGVANLRHFATHPGFTRQGIGRLIFSRCVEAARLAGVTIFQAYASLTAVAFYSSLGLQHIGDFDLQLGDGVALSAALMQGKV
jgi:GNAT superfamily N-acetyltransferase